MNDDDIRARLRAFGEQPIDEQTRASHLRRMAGAGGVDEPRRRGFVWAGIAAAAVVGFLAGSTGLALADALPDPAQEVAHDVLRVVQVDVPQGKEGKRGPCVAEAAKIKDKDAKKAAKDACPKGGGDESGDDSGTPGQGPPAADDPCHGRPPWAGPMSKEQRAEAKASASRANCPKDADDEDKDQSADEDEDASADDADAATTTESTTSTTSTTTTTTTSTTTEPDESSAGG